MSLHLDLTVTQMMQTPAVAVHPHESSWRYTARPEWSSSGESIWMRLSKFSYCNRLSVIELIVLFGSDNENSDAGFCTHDLRPTSLWKLQALATIMNISTTDVQSGFCSTLVPLQGRCATELRYCPACLELGFHAAWFQWLSIERCPLHGLPLTFGCALCKSPIPYVMGHDLAAKPLTCACCAANWVPSLNRPRGRCIPLGRHDGRVMGRWSNYVARFTANEHLRFRNQHTGQFSTLIHGVSCTATQTAPLTLVNRMYDVPPPSPIESLSQHCEPRFQRSAQVVQLPETSTSLGFGFERELWPHFGEDFFRYERQIGLVRHELFAITANECDHGCWQHLLGANPVVAANTIECETVAELGWAISWLGRARALAAANTMSTPALGLTIWLASLALRAQRTSKDRWHLQVLEWLDQDLRLSACMWMRVARFMKAKGTYLLHPAMVNPQDLAIARRTHSPYSCIFTSIIR
jgi:hypothetical protein